jgi:CPA1 family monovalent cation:H+ antiporter
MHEIQILLVLLVGVVLLAVLAGRIGLPYPVLLVGLGLTVGLVPGLPRITLAPDLVFLLFLPPILYAAAWYTSFNDFMRNIEPITVLAVGLVLATTVGILIINGLVFILIGLQLPYVLERVGQLPNWNCWDTALW